VRLPLEGQAGLSSGEYCDPFLRGSVRAQR
jgi:hypothetical protein